MTSSDPMEQYEKTISELKLENEKLKQQYEKTISELKLENEKTIVELKLEFCKIGDRITADVARNTKFAEFYVAQPIGNEFGILGHGGDYIRHLEKQIKYLKKYNHLDFDRFNDCDYSNHNEYCSNDYVDCVIM